MSPDCSLIIVTSNHLQSPGYFHPLLPFIRHSRVHYTYVFENLLDKGECHESTVNASSLPWNLMVDKEVKLATIHFLIRLLC